MKVDPGAIGAIVRAKQPARLPVVLTREEVRALLDGLQGVPRLVCILLYGSGLRLLEALQLRVKDVDFATGEIQVRRAKGAKDRVTVLPGGLTVELKHHLERVRELHRKDVAGGAGKAPLPYAFERKSPSAATDWTWQYVSRRRGATWILWATTAGTTYTSRRSSARCAPRPRRRAS